MAERTTAHEFILLTSRPITFAPPGPNWRVRRFRGPKGTNGLPWLQLYGPWLLRRERIDVFWGPHFLVPLLTSVPALVTVHDLVYRFFPQTMERYNYLAFRTQFAPSLQRARHITTVSRTTADDLQQTMGVAPSKVTVVYPGVAKPFYPRDPEEAARRVAAAFGLRSRYLLAVSTLEPRKNLPTLLRAFAALPEALRRTCPLVVAGYRGWKSTETLAAAAALERNGSVRLLGYVSDADLPWLYAGATALVFPSRYEGFGLPVVEAMACGIPAVISDIPVLREVAGDAAVFVPPMDDRAWTDAILAMIEDAPRRAALREAGLRRAGRFSYASSARQILGILEGLAR
ncbi:MAG TPA: glycosyltransferase family 1 protein [bacterium]|nr:glycosyltransferase family 1 protein [bacterium]